MHIEINIAVFRNIRLPSCSPSIMTTKIIIFNMVSCQHHTPSPQLSAVSPLEIRNMAGSFNSAGLDGRFGQSKPPATERGVVKRACCFQFERCCVGGDNMRPLPVCLSAVAPLQRVGSVHVLCSRELVYLPSRRLIIFVSVFWSCF